MNLVKKLSVPAMTLGLTFGALTLGGAACGGSTPHTKPADQGGDQGTGGDQPAKGDGGATGGEKAGGDEGGEHTCGAGSCGR